MSDQSKARKKQRKADRVLGEKRVIVSGSKEEMTYLNNLADTISNIDGDFVVYAAEQLAMREAKEKQSDSLTLYYHHQLMDACLEPLTKGLNADSIITAIGMHAGMCLVNRDFRANCKAGVGNMLYPYVNKKAESAEPTSIWHSCRDRILRAENDGRLPLSPKDTALQHLSFGRYYYDAIRQPGADVNALTDQYNTAVSMLFDQAQKDGCSYDEIATCQRTIVGQMIDRDPANCQYFDGIAFGDLKKDVGRVSDGVEIWKGEYKNKDGSAFTDLFTPRPVANEKKHAFYFDRFVTDAMDGCETIDKVNDNLRSADHINQRNLHIGMMGVDGMSVDKIQGLIINCMRSKQEEWLASHPEKEQQNTRAHASSDFSQKDSDQPRSERPSPFGDAFISRRERESGLTPEF